MKQKLIVFISLLFTINFVYSQDLSLTYSFDFKEISLLTALKRIEQESSFTIYFKKEWIENKQINMNYQYKSLKDILDDLLEPMELFYTTHDGAIYITKDKEIITDFPFIYSSTQQQNTLPAGLVFKNDYTFQSDSLYQGKVIVIGKQSKYVRNQNILISGQIKDIEGKPVKDALVYTDDAKSSAVSDENGNYLLSLGNGKNILFVQRIGYNLIKASVVGYSDGQLDFVMTEDLITLNEVEIRTDRAKNITNPLMGISKMKIEDVKNVPFVLGEKDIIGVAISYPGIQKTGEAAAGFNVRGGKSDQNLILLDGNTVYNINHFFGFFSAFNSDLLQSMDIFTGSMPAEYGGRLSSIFKIETKTPNRKKLNFEIGVSPVTSKFKAEFPIIKDKASLMVGIRNTYSNWILRLIDNVEFNQNRVSFYDLNLVYSHLLDEKNELKLTLYNSNDYFNIASDTLLNFSDFTYRNNIGSVKWNHTIDENRETELHIGYTNYNYNLTNTESEINAFNQTYSISEYNTKFIYSHFLGEDVNLKTGLESKLYGVNPGTKDPIGLGSEVATVNVQEDTGLETALFAGLSYSFSGKINLDFGLRLSNFLMMGARQVPVYNEGSLKIPDNVIDTLNYGSNEIVEDHWQLDYRLSIGYIITKNSSIKASLNRTTQYIHSLTNSASLSPTDIWVLSSNFIQPQTANQVSLGFYQNLNQNMYEASVDVYYKLMNNLVDFKTGAEFLLNENIEQAVLQGPGRAYGLEFSLKKSGKLNGWLNYTYSRSFIQLDGIYADETINRGEFFPTNYDQPHSANLVANYKFTQRISLSLNGAYKTGRPVTFPTGEYDFKDINIVHYGDRNEFRIPYYFRIDAGINLEEGHKINKNLHSTWSFSVYNLLGRNNVYSIYFDNSNGVLRGYQLTIFNQPIPTLTFNLRLL